MNSMDGLIVCIMLEYMLEPPDAHSLPLGIILHAAYSPQE